MNTVTQIPSDQNLMIEPLRPNELPNAAQHRLGDGFRCWVYNAGREEQRGVARTRRGALCAAARADGSGVIERRRRWNATSMAGDNTAVAARQLDPVCEGD